MNAPIPKLLDDADWDVPTFEVAEYRPKANKYALVIPVINEGERIRGQLTRIKDAQLPVDVVVADGGSTDGSLGADFVAPIGVRVVLTKTGPGKLSAQLRMAYAWCLREGYAGIVTIDGNGKDGVEAVADFVAKLEEGCDYVQGSRYLKGGAAENTPLERTIANRLIHAPVLSIAGRHWFTDTTNGFRAYSARYLTHPEVRPFRDEFAIYNLLFYLTVRAGQLGLKVDQVPVIRRYPESGKVPTKIGGLSSKLALLGETVTAATGGYTPDKTAPQVNSFGWPAMVAGTILLVLFLSIIVAPNYSPDSWALYELSKTVFSDFYRFTHFRSYSSVAEYSSAFAPLWPTLIAMVDGILGTGARTGLYLAFLSFFAFVLVSERIGHQITGAKWIGLGVALLLLLGPKMVWDELSAGRTIPMQLLLYGIVLHGLLEGKTTSLGRAAVIGFVTGLAVMNRFDAALLPIFVVLIIGWMTRSPLLALSAFAASIIAMSPWIAYSLSTFGTVFATDNSAVATTLDRMAFVTDWWPAAQPTLMDDPAEWLLKVLGNAGQWIATGVSILISPLGFAFLAAASVTGAVRLLCAKAPRSQIAQLPQHRRPILAVFAVSLVAMMVPQVLTGYLEYRYYSPVFWAVLMLVAAWLISAGVTRHQRHVFAMVFAGVVSVWLTGFVAVQSFGAAGSGQLDSERWSEFEAPKDVASLRQCLGDDVDARILVIGDDAFAARAGALGSLRTMMEPRNMAEGRLDETGRADFIESWQVDYLLVFAEDRAQEVGLFPDFAPVPDCDLSLFKQMQ